MHCRRFPYASTVLLLAFGVMMTGCEKEKGPTPDTQVDALRLRAELDRTRSKLATTEKESVAKDDAVTLAKEETESVKKQLAEKEGAIHDREAQMKALQGELADMKKRDAFVFAEISKLVQQKLTTTALDRYRQFVKDFPQSPLVADADRAIADLTVTAPRDVRARVAVIDPKAPERDLLKKFTEGDVTLEEMAPFLKGKSLVEVLRLLGAPNKTFREGTELGYVDKITEPATGERSTLVISFDQEKVVSALSAGYAGRSIRP